MTPKQYRAHRADSDLTVMDVATEHVRVLRAAMQRQRPVNAAAVTAYGLPLPGCYVLSEARYVVETSNGA